MHLSHTAVDESPDDCSSVRICGEVTYGDSALGSEVYWFDLPKELAQSISASSNAWLVLLAPLAATLGESLSLPAPVDGTLLTNIREVLRIWVSWYPNLQEIAIEAPECPPATESAGESRVASFFSGGVDSLFTVLRHHNRRGTPTTVDIDDLIFLGGFDIPVDRHDTITRVEGRLEAAAEQLGKRLVTVKTNVRETRFQLADWEHLTHGAALACVGLMLEPRYAKILIGSSAGYRDLRFWGSHPLVDPLFSTGTTQIVHDGPAFMRVEKTQYVAQFDLALETLRVCWKSDSGNNCGECNNCIRTMLALEALGVLSRCPAFPQDALDIEKAGHVYCPNSWDVRQFGYIRDLAAEVGRFDIVDAVDSSLRGSQTLKRRLHTVRRLWSIPFVQRSVTRLERHLMSGWVT